MLNKKLVVMFLLGTFSLTSFAGEAERNALLRDARDSARLPVLLESSAHRNEIDHVRNFRGQSLLDMAVEDSNITIIKFLVNVGISGDLQKQGLKCAAMNGRLDAFTELLRSVTDQEARGEALELAARYGQLNIVNAFITDHFISEKGVEEIYRKKALSAVFQTLYQKKKKLSKEELITFQEIIKKFFPLRDVNERTIVMERAAESGLAEIFKMAWDRTLVSTQTKRDRLLNCVAMGGCEEIFKIVWSLDLSPDKLKRFLMDAASFENSTLVKIVSAKVNQTAVDEILEEYLFWHRGSSENVIKELIKRASQNTIDKVLEKETRSIGDGFVKVLIPAASQAAKNNTLEWAIKERKYLVGFLLSHGADVNGEIGRRSFLDYAIGERDHWLAQDLLRHKDIKVERINFEELGERILISLLERYNGHNHYETELSLTREMERMKLVDRMHPRHVFDEILEECWTEEGFSKALFERCALAKAQERRLSEESLDSFKAVLARCLESRNFSPKSCKEIVLTTLGKAIAEQKYEIFPAAYETKDCSYAIAKGGILSFLTENNSFDPVLSDLNAIGKLSGAGVRLAPDNAQFMKNFLRAFITQLAYRWDIGGDINMDAIKSPETMTRELEAMGLFLRQHGLLDLGEVGYLSKSIQESLATPESLFRDHPFCRLLNALKEHPTLKRVINAKLEENQRALAR